MIHVLLTVSSTTYLQLFKLMCNDMILSRLNIKIDTVSVLSISQKTTIIIKLFIAP